MPTHHDKHNEHLEHAAHHGHKRKAVLIAIAGALIVLNGVWLDHLNRDVLLTRDQASNSWSYFHQKSIKERIYESELSFAEYLETERIADLQNTVARYQAEQDELIAKASAEEDTVKKKLTQIKYAEITAVLIEFAIILLSVSIVLPVLWLEILAISALLGGVLATSGSLL